MSIIKVLVGAWGEKKVCRHLEELGYKIIETNYKTLFGEIDIIAKHKNYLVFIEVKTRNSFHYSALYDVNSKKIKKIIKTAESYLQKNNLKDIDIRFDVVVLENNKIEILENAFMKN